MFCEKCGTQLPDNAPACPNCGAKVESAPNANSVLSTDKSKNKLIGIAAVALVAVIALIILIVVLAGGGYKSTIKKYMAVWPTINEEKSVKSLYKLYPKEVRETVIEYYEDKFDTNSEDEVYEKIAERYNYTIDDLDDKYGDDWKLSYKIKRVKDLNDREVEELQDRYANSDYELDIEIKAVKKVYLEITIQSKNGKDKDKKDLAINLIKVDGSWYMDRLFSLDSLLAPFFYNSSSS